MLKEQEHYWKEELELSNTHLERRHIKMFDTTSVNKALNQRYKHYT